MSTDQITQITLEGGNTKTPSKRYRNWLFTLNNPTETDYTQITQNFTSYVYQTEKVSTTHIQGYIELKNAMTLSAIHKLLPRAHFEPRKGTKEQAIAYCTKQESRVNGPITKGIAIPQEIKTIVPNWPWEQKVLKLIEPEPDDRTIIWIWEPEGCKGKTQFQKYLAVHKKALELGGKGSDMKNGIVNHLENGNPPPTIVMINITRTISDYVSFEGIEAIKDGIFFSGKYKGSMVLYNSPHVLIFANEPPMYHKLSIDRWKVYKIDENKDLIKEQ
ncbi:rep protein [Circoviridae sp.]|nr:rep protein [Circoviridae sp.]